MCVCVCVCVCETAEVAEAVSEDMGGGGRRGWGTSLNSDNVAVYEFKHI